MRPAFHRLQEYLMLHFKLWFRQFRIPSVNQIHKPKIYSFPTNFKSYELKPMRSHTISFVRRISILDLHKKYTCLCSKFLPFWMSHIFVIDRHWNSKLFPSNYVWNSFEFSCILIFNQWVELSKLSHLQ